MDSSFTIDCQIAHRNPDLVLYRNLLSKAECDYLIDVAQPHLKRSLTFSTNGDDPRRTSSSAFSTSFPNDPIIKKLVDRCSALCGYPASHVEPPQIVRYFPGEKYIEHADNYAPNQKSYKLSGQRDYTFFIYLNEPSSNDFTGGETFFPKIEDGIKIKPERGMAVFWRNIKIPDRTDENRDWILHAGVPPDNWTKYGMNCWIRSKPWIG